MMKSDSDPQRAAAVGAADYRRAVRHVRSLVDESNRELRIWWARTVGLAKAPTLQELGDQMNITRSRVQQLEAKAEQRAGRMLDELRSGPAGIVAQALSQRLGPAYSVDKLRWRSLGLVPEIAEQQASLDQGVTPTQAGLLFLYLAGPYRVDGRWLVPADSDIFQAIRSAITDAADGQYPSMSEARRIVRELGAVPSQCGQLLSDTQGIIVLDNKVCPWPDNAEGRAEVILGARGGPMRRAELARLVGRHLGTVSNVLAQSPLFARVDVDSFGLAEWGLPTFDGIVNTMKDSIRRGGGVATRQQIMDDLLRFPIAPSSVNVYLGTHHFVRVARGRFRVRQAPDPLSVGAVPPPETTRSAFLVAGRWMIRFDVNGERLRGSGCPLPRFMAAMIELGPGSERLVPVVDDAGKRLDIVRCTWPTQMPSIGSLARVIEELDLGLGDYLFLDWDERAESFSALGVASQGCEEMTEQCVRAQVTAQIGRPDLADASTPEVLKAVCSALGFEGSDRAAVISRLQRRQDEQLTRLYRTLHDLEVLRTETRGR